MRRRSLLLLPLLWLAACADSAPPPAAAPELWREMKDAGFARHRGGVPHTDRLGLPRQSLDPARSLFALVLDNAMVDYQRGVRFGFANAAAAGFNGIAPWPQQPREAILQAAAGSRLLAVMPRARPGETDSIEIDDIAWFDPANIDLVRLFPFHSNRPAILGGREGLSALRQRVAAQSEAARPRPVWTVLQAFAAPGEERRLPTPQEARALAYGALAEGASGLVWFAEDSYASRSIGALGIAPGPPLDYGVQVFGENPARMLQPTPNQVAAAGSLWQAIARMNREIERLTPALLSHTAMFDYRVRLLPLDNGVPADAMPSEGTPLRLLLKSFDDRYTLLAVNVTDRPWKLNLLLPQPMRRIERWFDNDPPPALQRGGTEIEEDFPPYTVRVYRLSP
ncbi:hypothetical protein [Ferrovibrio sp.]|uniref:hypothetical protein n=1 Tax=Ferrovibrio sp. TaxID=1917215 RepID=UPI003D10CD4F